MAMIAARTNKRIAEGISITFPSVLFTDRTSLLGPRKNPRMRSIPRATKTNANPS